MPGRPKIACSTAVATRSSGACAIASMPSNAQVCDVRRHVQHRHDQHAGEHRERQIAAGFAQLVGRKADVVPGVHREQCTDHRRTEQRQRTESDAAFRPERRTEVRGDAAPLRPIVRPSSINASSDSTLIDVSNVCTNAATRTPRTLIHVSTKIDAIASTRCGDRPTSIGPLGQRHGEADYRAAATAAAPAPTRTARSRPRPPRSCRSGSTMNSVQP